MLLPETRHMKPTSIQREIHLLLLLLASEAGGADEERLNHPEAIRIIRSAPKTFKPLLRGEKNTPLTLPVSREEAR
ncbi:hypothetical protein EYF80_047196 [Liparis tanakae]|uniref:Uncharacterized protein n=1 Tax=Liparis tanakae TaxID=230148 RepID=A0A4Z2FN96_9TELE|nr:hypothetical protein EYF80_047196 [Liparis tanakae]